MPITAGTSMQSTHEAGRSHPRHLAGTLDRMLSAEFRIIYDFGAGNGADLPYYLLKADRVVAVEANPVHCDEIRSHLAEPLTSGRLVVVNAVLDVAPGSRDVPFYIHKTRPWLSQYPRPAAEQCAAFTETLLPARNVVDMIREYGDPYYVKIDLEHFDHVILRALFEQGIRPPYISAEAHTAEVFAILLALGGYQSFKLVDGPTVRTRYRDRTISTTKGTTKHSFAHAAAGPFGNDIDGPWMAPNPFLRLLGYAGLGARNTYKDIHASRVDPADPNHSPQPQFRITVDF
jgi:FkbM family methyltransferase